MAELPLPESWRVRLDDALLAGLSRLAETGKRKGDVLMITLIDDALLDAVCAEAAASPRRRKNRNFHPRDDHPGHRLLNALMADTYIPPHRISTRTRTRPTSCCAAGSAWWSSTMPAR
jgi:hypothetical protein